MKFESKYKKTLSDTFWLFFGNGSKKRTEREIDGSLHYAALTNKLWRADYLIRECGAPVTSGDNFCIRWAANGGHNEMIKLLVEKGADVNARDGEALVRAVEKGHDATAALLIDSGAKVALHKAKALYLADAAHNIPLLKKMLSTGEDLVLHVRNLMEKAHENQAKDLLRLYEDYILDPPAPPAQKLSAPPAQKPKSPQLKK